MLIRQHSRVTNCSPAGGFGGAEGEDEVKNLIGRTSSLTPNSSLVNIVILNIIVNIIVTFQTSCNLMKLWHINV